VRVHPPGSGRSRRKSRRSLVARALLATLAITSAAAVPLAIALAISEPLRARLLEFTGASQTNEGVAALMLAPMRLLQARLNSPPPRIALDVKFKHMLKIHEKRSRALASGTLETSDDDFLPGKIDTDGHPAPMRLRLSGERPDLLDGEKWPLRINTRGDALVLGMQRFELKDPAAHGFQSERLFIEHLRREDVLAPRSSFADISLNGKDVGLMTLEESPALELLESQQRRDGAFLRLAILPGNEHTLDLIESSPGGYRIEPLRPRDLDRSGKLARSFKAGRRLLRGYFEGSVPADDVFDAESWGRFLAIAELWGAETALHWANLRFYLNPLTQRLEPLGHSPGLAFGKSESTESPIEAQFAADLLESPRIRNAYRRSLVRIAAEMLEPDYQEQSARLQDEQLRLLHREFPFRVAFDLAPVLQRARQARARSGNEPIPRHEAATVRPPNADVETPLPFVGVAETLERHPFLQWDPGAREFFSPAGHWNVSGHMILPEGTGLRLPPGTTLRFEARRGIIARGPLIFRGNADAPVVLEGPAGSKRAQLWSGVYVVESTQPSKWQHVVVRNAGGFDRKKWRLAGGVVFRKTTVEIDDCRFIATRTDDALNMVRSDFAIRNPTILDSRSDGFDADYATGSIEDGVIERAGGDAIDLGGSNVEIRGIRMASIRDKAVSVGERSRLTADALTIEHVGIGIASKNGSHAELMDSTLHSIREVALIAYVNRGGFGPATLIADRNRITNADLVALTQSGNHIVLDGVPLKPVDAALDRLYKDGENER